eukprot:IDg9548t1
MRLKYELADKSAVRASDTHAGAGVEKGVRTSQACCVTHAHKQLITMGHFNGITTKEKGKSWQALALESPFRLRVLVPIAMVLWCWVLLRDVFEREGIARNGIVLKEPVRKELVRKELVRKELISKPLPPQVLKRAEHASSIKIYTDEAQSTQVCGIPDACVLSAYDADAFKRVVYVPARYQRHKTRLSRCIPYNFDLQFYDRSSPPRELQKPLRDRINVDALGIPITDNFFAHFAHFGPQFVGYTLLPTSLFLAKNRTLRVRCLSNSGELSECAGTNAWPTALRVVVGESEFVTGWVRDFLGMLTQDGRYLHKTRAYNASHAPPLCFRSLLVTKRGYDSGLEVHDRLLRSKGISRVLAPGRGRACAPRVVVLLRAWKWRVARTVPERARNALRTVIESRLAAANITPNVEVIIDLSQGRNLSQQIAVMQRADILLAVRGAELTNTIFMRNGATVIEISPFGNHFGYFEGLFGSAKLNFVRLCSPPDPPEFRKCVIKAEPNVTSANVDRAPAVVEYNLLTQQFRTENNPITSPKACRLDLFRARVCARSQQIPIDPSKIAAVVAQRAGALCNSASHS